MGKAGQHMIWNDWYESIDHWIGLSMTTYSLKLEFTSSSLRMVYGYILLLNGVVNDKITLEIFAE